MRLQAPGERAGSPQNVRGRQVQGAHQPRQRLDLATPTRAEAYNLLSPGAAEAKGDRPQERPPFPPLRRLAASAAGFGLADFARIRGVD
jgi:hypothetical protein